MIWLIGLLLFSLLIIGLRHWINNPKRSFFIDPVYSFNTNKKELILSFDDGPGPATPALLALLKQYNIKVIFFVNGDKIERYPEIARQAIQEGHLLANHSYQHESMVFKSFSYIEKDMLKTDSLIRQVGQQTIKLYRPPYGKSFINLPLVLKKHQKKMFNWSISPPAQFATTFSKENITNQTLNQLHPGGIILLHDGWDDTDPTDLVTLVDQIIFAAQEEGYNFVLPTNIQD